MKKGLIFSFFLLILFPAASVDFSETQSDHFAVYSSASSSESSLLAHDMERLYSEATDFLGMAPQSTPLRVYHFHNRNAYRNWMRSEWGYEAEEHFSLLEKSMMSPPLLALYGDWKDNESDKQLRFLLMHLMLKQLNTEIPSWLSLGLSATFEGTSQSENLPQPALVNWVNSRGEGFPWHSPEELLQVQQDFLESLPELKGELWLLISFMMEDPTSDNAALLRDSLSLLISGEKGPWPDHNSISREMTKDYQNYRENLQSNQEQLKELMDAYTAEDYPGVLELSEEIEESHPAPAFYYRALVEFKKGEWEESRSSFLQALEAGAPEAEVRSSLALCYWELDLIEMARQELNRVAELDQNLVPEQLQHLLD